MNVLSQQIHKAIMAYRTETPYLAGPKVGQMLRRALITYRDQYRKYTRIKKVGFWGKGDAERMQALLDSLGLVHEKDYIFDGHILIYCVAK